MSYWDVLAEADHHLEREEFAAAETAYASARSQRGGSPGRVFVSERLGDATRRLWRRVRDGAAAQERPGRWEAATADFAVRFRERATVVLARARDAAVLAEGDPAVRLAVLAQGLHLAGHSELLERDDPLAFSLLAAALRDARACGRLLDAELFPPDLDCDENGRLDLAGAGLAMITTRGAASASGTERRALAGALLRLIDEERFAPHGPHEPGRCWLAARITDLGLADSPAAADLYRRYLAGPASADHAAAARVRLVEILGNVDRQHLDIPRYDEARAAAGGAPPSAPELAQRLAVARESLRPRLDQTRPAWAVLTPAASGWEAVLWRGDRAVDAARWREGADVEPLRRFLAPCAGRVIAAGGGGAPVPAFPLGPIAEALLEPWLPPSGLSPDATADLVAAAAPDAADAGGAGCHPRLPAGAPPDESPLAAAVEAGRLWLACLARVRAADPRLETGLVELARRGDEAAALVTAGLTILSGRSRGPSANSGTEGSWALTPLVDRPSPLLPCAEAESPGAVPAADLAGQPALMVATGRPGTVLAAWGASRDRWRVVLDDPGRLPVLARALSGHGGLLTLQPERLHARDTALDRLVELAAAGAPGDALALFFWCRLTESHNGDLADFAVLRPRPAGAVPLYDRFLDLAAALPRSEAGAATPWGREYAARAVASRVVVGAGHRLDETGAGLDAWWGLSAERPAAWAFCDGPSVVWQLKRRARGLPDMTDFPPLSPASDHLSLVLGGTLFCEEMAAFLTAVRDGVFPEAESPFRILILPDARPSPLRLALGGPDPDSRVLRGEALAAALARFEATPDQEGRALMLVPGRGSLRTFLQAMAREDLARDGDASRRFLDPEVFWSARGRALVVGRRLHVARLESLDPPSAIGTADHAGGDARAWAREDELIAEALEAARADLAFELSALLARGAGLVDVADVRWWRRFPLPGSRSAPSLAEAARLCIGDAADLYELAPAVAGRRRLAGRREPTSPLARTCLDWLRGEGRIDAGGEGLPPGIDRPPARELPEAWERRPLRLVVGGDDAAWAEAVRSVCRRREAGDLDAWLLFVGEAPPAGAREILRRLPAAESAVGRGGPPPALKCLSPDSLTDPGVQEMLAHRSSPTVYAADLRDWLPPLGDAAMARSLRWLVTAVDGPVTFQASTLPEPWADWLRGLWRDAAADRGLVDATAEAGTDAPDLPPVAVGRFGDPETSCPRCGAVFGLRHLRVPCPECGFAPGAWLAPEQLRQLATELVGLKVAALRERADLGADLPLRIWAQPESLPDLCERIAAFAPLREEADGQLTAEPGGGRLWELAVLAPGAVVPPNRRHALLDLPDSAEDLFRFRRRAAGEVGLWFHPLELARQFPDSDGGAPLAQRFAWLPEALAAPPGMPPEQRWRGALPPRVAGTLSGLPPRLAAAALEVAAWTAAADGFPPAAVPVASVPALAPSFPFAELEFRVRDLSGLMQELLPVILAGSRSGVVSLIDLTELPFSGDASRMAWLDRFLLGISLRLTPPGAVGEPELLYAPDDGVLASPRRRVGRLGGVQEVVARAVHHAELFLASARALYATATPAGDLIPLDGDGALAAGDDVIETGILLGAWGLAGAPRPGDLEVPAAVPPDDVASDGSSDAAILLAGLASSRERWGRRLAEGWRNGFLEDAPAVGEAAVREPEVTTAVAKVVDHLAAFLSGAGAGQRAVRGPAGSGRLDAVLLGLARAVRAGLPPREATVFAPDPGTLSRCHLLWRTLAPDLVAPRLLLVDDPEAALPGVAGAAGLPGRPERAVAVLLEAQDMPADARFRIAQHYRRGRLVVVVEPVLSVDPWDHLFLTTPRAEEVLDLADPIVAARLPWRECRELAAAAGSPLGRGHPVRREKGECAAHWTTNLDECLGFLARERGRGLFGDEVLVVAPVADDLAYLGRSLAREGWLPVFRAERDALLLPGPLELLAAAVDAVARAEADGDEAPSLLAGLLAGERRRAYLSWLRDAAPAPGTRLTDLLEMIAAGPWADAVLAPPENRRRVEALVAEAGDEPLDRLCARPLLTAWRRRVADLPGQPPAPDGPPVAALATPAAPGALPAADVVYLCLGSEPPQRHYRVLSRARDRAHVLYQERSPLPGDTDDLG